ncbi:DUF4238 domain-containing protein [Arthrobacter livingstonensis]|nr:DUF4238 domain-containing protein [Arthrobacter livingstonensis]
MNIQDQDPPAPAITPELQRILDAAAAMTAKGQEPRRHHLVPKFYLERWAINNRILVTDLDINKSFPVAPINALIETDYYRVPEGSFQGGSPVVWETWLSTIEGHAKSVFDAIDKNGLPNISDIQHAHLLHFLGVQITRSRSYRFRGRWMMGPGYYQAMELNRPGAIEALLIREGGNPSPERISELEAYFAQVNADPWRVPMAAEQEMLMSTEAGGKMAETLHSRQLVLYTTAKPLLTCDEPVVLLHEHMGALHPDDGGYLRAPIIAFPFGPREVLAMFREDLPLSRPNNVELDWRETLELNRAIAGNAHRHLVEGPDGGNGANLYVPAAKDPVRMVTLPPAEGNGHEVLWTTAQRRWTGEHDAPVRPVSAWWPAAVPPPPQGPARPAV